MKKYAQSNYNFCVNYLDKIVYFNGISKVAFAVNEKEHLFFQEQFNNLDIFESKYPTLLKLFVDNFFIKDCAFNELDYIRFLNRKDIFLNNMYRITINPTLECNFKCWYCFEEHPKGYLSEDLQNKIIQHVEYVAKHRLVKGIDLSWFGGEPLLYFETIVQPMSEKIQIICNKYGILFNNHATTNAYLIDSKMIDKFKKIKLNSFQITLDGDEERHNKIRNEKGKPSFQSIIDNINSICENMVDANIILRINYDDVTLKKIHPVFNYFDKENRKKISISFNRVWQTVKNIDERNEKDQENSALLNILLSECIEMGYDVSFPDDVRTTFRRCHADKYWHAEINYDGKLFKCGVDYSEESQGEFTDDGRIEWSREVCASIYGNATFENDMCIPCKLLPICLGPCSRKISQSNRSCLEKFCNMKTSDLDIDNTIISYFLSHN